MHRGSRGLSVPIRSQGRPRPRNQKLEYSIFIRLIWLSVSLLHLHQTSWTTYKKSKSFPSLRVGKLSFTPYITSYIFECLIFQKSCVFQKKSQQPIHPSTEYLTRVYDYVDFFILFKIHIVVQKTDLLDDRRLFIRQPQLQGSNSISSGSR